MGEIRVIDVHQGIFERNDSIAAEVRAKMKKDKTFMINLMASPGAGKTTLLLATAARIKDRYNIGVMEADIDASVDAEKMEAAGLKSIQVHTGGECAMDAAMTSAAVNEFGTEELDILIMENVGNMVCPAETDTGATKNVVLLSIPEGDDKPLKYPLMFEVGHCYLITKTDTKAYFNFDEEAVIRNIRAKNPNAEILFLSAKTGEGMDAWIDWLTKEADLWIGR